MVICNILQKAIPKTDSLLVQPCIIAHFQERDVIHVDLFHDSLPLPPHQLLSAQYRAVYS